MTSAICTVNALSTTSGVVDVAPSTTVTVALSDSAGANFWTISAISPDDTVNLGTINSSISINQTTKTATFASPQKGSVIFRSVVNGGININGAIDTSLTSEFKVSIAINGVRTICLNETYQGNPLFGWSAAVNDSIRAQQTVAIVRKDLKTVNNTPTTIASYTLNPEKTCRYGATIQARSNDSSIAKIWALQRSGTRTAAGSLVPGSLISLQDVEVIGGADPGYAATIDTSGNTFRVRVTGDAAANTFWSCTTETLESLATTDLPIDAPSTSPPTISGMFPDLGVNLSGQAVTISGANFIGATAVTIGGTALTSVVILSASVITAVMPATTAGMLTCSITTTAGTGTRANAYASLEVASNSLYSLHYGGAGVTLSGSDVVSVADQGTIGANALLTPNLSYTSPSFSASNAGYNSKPTFSFLDAGSNMHSSAYTANAPITRFLVGNTTNVYGGLPKYLADGLSGYLGISGSSTSSAEAYQSASLTSTDNSSIKQIWNIVYNTTTSFISASSTTETSGSVGTSTPGGLTLGSFNGGAYGCQGTIALCFQVHGTLTKAQRDTNKQTLGAYYGKTIS